MRSHPFAAGEGTLIRVLDAFAAWLQQGVTSRMDGCRAGSEPSGPSCSQGPAGERSEAACSDCAQIGLQLGVMWPGRGCRIHGRPQVQWSASPQCCFQQVPLFKLLSRACG